MAKNDKVLLDGIIDDRIEMQLPSEKRDEAFEYLAFEQILKDADLSRDEIESGWIDGRGDGGIDGFFVLVNGHLLQEPESFVWPRAGSELQLSIITCKHHDTFRLATLDSLAASLTELFNFELNDDDLKGSYSESVIECRNILKTAYRKLSSRMSKFTIEISYASRGDTTDIGDEVKARSKHIKSIAKDYFSTCVSRFTFYGSTELVQLYRKMPNYSLELPFVEALSRGERYVLLTKLRDYFNFVSDNGKLRRYLFDSNVRDFMGLNRVNEDIKSTLENQSSPDFWWLNNGVTILATSASVVGKSIQIDDIQIVNGLQTTESIFRHFEHTSDDSDDRSVLVKILVTRDESVRDSIIRATNNQTDVELASLHATDKIQRDIEEILVRSGFFYERRKNYYVNLGHSPREIITPLYLATGYVSLLLKQPHRATSLRSKFMNSPEAYKLVFSENAPIEIWPKIAVILKTTDEVLESVRPTKGHVSERFLKSWRHIISFITLSRVLGSFDFTPQQLINIDTDEYTSKQIIEVWDWVNKFITTKVVDKRTWSSKQSVLSLCSAAENHFHISGLQRLNKTVDFAINSDALLRAPMVTTMEFALKVKELLPEQPWKPGLHRKISQTIGCSANEFFNAVELLIKEGLVNRQTDGVVFDADGKVVCFDPERVNPDTLLLIDSTDQ